MPFMGIDEVAPRIVGGKRRIVYLDDFNTITGVAKYKGCFVRRRRLGTDVDPPIDTIRLTNGAQWSAVETSGSDNYNNKPFGIITSYPEKINEVEGGNSLGKLSVCLLGGRQPVRVAFRLVNSSYNYIRPTPDLVGKQLYIHGKQENIGGTNYIIPVVSQTGSGTRFYVADIVPPPKLTNSLLGTERELGWVVLVLDTNFFAEPF
jgi:hypothetical protein